METTKMNTNDTAAEIAATPATTAPRKGLMQFDAIRDRVVGMIGAERFDREATHLLRELHDTPSLASCTPASVAGALLTIATTGLTLNQTAKELYLIPRNTKVKGADGEKWERRLTVVPSYIGMMRVALSGGAVSKIIAHEVYQGDEFAIDLVDARPSTHKPYWMLGRERGPIIGAYATATLRDGAEVVEIMGADEIAKIRSKSDNSNGSVHTDWAGEMARKMVVKRLLKYLPITMSEALSAVIDADNDSVERTSPVATSIRFSPAQMAQAKAEIASGNATAEVIAERYPTLAADQLAELKTTTAQ